MLCPYKRIQSLIILTFTVLFILISYTNPEAVRAATLLETSDYITSDETGKNGVTHNIRFRIPDNGHNIIATDYIRIRLVEYSDITPPTSSSGHVGSPTYGSIGTTAYITGVTAPTSSVIGISGITATNPNSGNFNVVIEITNDINGTVVYDSAMIAVQILKHATTTSVTVPIDSVSVNFHGYTSPEAFVTILLDNETAGTTIANQQGTFQKRITGLDPNTNYSVAISAQDISYRQSDSISFTIQTISSTELTINNLVIPTTIDISNKIIKYGDSVDIFGYTYPASQVSTFIDQNPSIIADAKASGYWSVGFNTCLYPMDIGNHTASARVIIPGGHTSSSTQGLTFSIEECMAGDLNCDNSTNLIDFSILLFYWQQTNPANCRADINKDKIVNLTDFSILLYNWTG